MFTIRNFRITGIGVAANALLILAPLPWLMRTYESFVPTTMIYAIATGVASMAWVFLAMASWSSRPTRVLRRNPGAERLLPHERLIPIAAVALTILVVPVWIAVSGTPPLFRLLSGASSTELVMDRQASFSQLGSAPLRLVIGVLRNLLIMFASGWFIADALTTPRSAWRNRSRAELIAMAAIGIGVFFALLTTERAIVGELMVVCAIAGFIATGRTLSVRSVGALVAAAGSFPLAVGLLSGAGNLKEVIVGLGQRAFYLPTEVMVRYFVEFPRYHDYLGSTAIPKMSYITGQPTFDLSTHIYIRYYQSIPGVVGNANGSFLGVGWAAYGFAGVVIWSLGAAVAFVLLDKSIDRLPLRSSAALRGLGVIMAILSTSSDIFRSVLGFGPGIIDLIIVVWIISAIQDRRTYSQLQQLRLHAAESPVLPASQLPQD